MKKVLLMEPKSSNESCILSICIPTYNRAGLLQSALLSVAPQVAKFGSLVELIVSDNCSTDNTEQIVVWAHQFCDIKYHKNDTNIGASKNILNLPRNLAKGKFCWILGDDDFVREGGVSKVLDILQLNRDLDYVFVSLVHMDIEQLNKYNKPVSSSDLPENLPSDNQLHQDSPVDKWEDLINPDVSNVFLGAIQSSIFRRSIWNLYCNDLTIGPDFSSLESTYPHNVIFAKGLVGKKAYYIGTPLVIVVDGAREWWDLLPIVVLVRLNEVLDLYEACGVPTVNIRRCRSSLMASSGPLILKVVFNRSKSGADDFSVLKFIFKYCRYKNLWRSLLREILINKFTKRLFFRNYT